MSRKKNPRLDESNIYLVIDSKKVKQKTNLEVLKRGSTMIHKNGRMSHYITNSM